MVDLSLHHHRTPVAAPLARLLEGRAEFSGGGTLSDIVELHA
mgnify:CR=1 FL=1